MAGACLAAAVGSHWIESPPSPPGLAGDAGTGASYGGGAGPDSVADAGLGVDGVPLLLLPWSVHCGWAVGGVSGHGCRGGGPGWRSTWLALRRAPWRR